MSVMDDVEAALREPFDVAQLPKLLELREPLLQEKVKTHKELNVNREKLRVPKGKEYTDFDRNVMLEAYAADSTAVWELARGLEELLRERIELCKLMLTNTS